MACTVRVAGRSAELLMEFTRLCLGGLARQAAGATRGRPRGRDRRSGCQRQQALLDGQARIARPLVPEPKYIFTLLKAGFP